VKGRRVGAATKPEGRRPSPSGALALRARRAAIYLRVSSEEQTVENQRPVLERIVKGRGLELARVFEENVSATKRRPAFAAMLEAARMGEFDTLVIWAIDRFGRSLFGNVADVAKLSGYGVRLISCQESFLETEGPFRDLMIAIFSWFAEQELRRLSERTKAGMERARNSGLHVGRPRARVNLYEADCLRDELLAAGKPATAKVLARRIGVSLATFNRALAARAAKVGSRYPGAQR
jgi:DNA invertase Pin-like site-specific DNA recombinase